jgi:hypothetical protein
MNEIGIHAKLCGFLAVEVACLAEGASAEVTAEIEKASASLLQAKSLLYRAKNLIEAQKSGEAA